MTIRSKITSAAIALFMFGSTIVLPADMSPAASVSAVQLDAPEGISYTSGKDSITLTWDEVDGADAYRVYKYNASKKKYEKYKTVASESCTVDGLKSGSTYHFRVASLDKKDSSSYTEGGHNDIKAKISEKTNKVKIIPDITKYGFSREIEKVQPKHSHFIRYRCYYINENSLSKAKEYINAWKENGFNVYCSDTIKSKGDARYIYKISLGSIAIAEIDICYYSKSKTTCIWLDITNDKEILTNANDINNGKYERTTLPNMNELISTLTDEYGCATKIQGNICTLTFTTNGNFNNADEMKELSNDIFDWFYYNGYIYKYGSKNIESDTNWVITYHLYYKGYHIGNISFTADAHLYSESRSEYIIQIRYNYLKYHIDGWA